MFGSRKGDQALLPSATASSETKRKVLAEKKLDARKSKVLSVVHTIISSFDFVCSTNTNNHKMPLPKYSYNGPIDHTIVPDKSQLQGKSVIVTGGANGMGEMFVREFSKAGAFVTFGDMNERGTDIEKELNASGETVAFVKCDIRSWDDQIQLFETAKMKSPSKSVDIVIANAGISRSSGDSLWVLTGMYQ